MITAWGVHQKSSPGENRLHVSVDAAAKGDMGARRRACHDVEDCMVGPEGFEPPTKRL